VTLPVEMVPFLVSRNATAVLSVVPSVTVKLVALVISTSWVLAVVSV
jgi:hypothetical protein